MKDKKTEITVEISRVLRPRERAGVIYDRLSRWYDLLAGYYENDFRETALKLLDTKPGERVLDIGFGTGHSTLSLARLTGNTGMVYGIDISEGMCKITDRRIRRAGLIDRVRLICGDAIELPFKSEFFDALFMSFSLELFDTPEIPHVLSECRRVLKKDGRICIVAMSKKGKSGIVLKVYEWIHNRFPESIDCRPIFVQRALEENGFITVEFSSRSKFGLPVETVLGVRPFSEASTVSQSE